MSNSRRRFLTQIGAISTCGLLASIGNELFAQVDGPTRPSNGSAGPTGDERFVTLVHSTGWWSRLLRPQFKEQPASQWILPEALEPLQSRRSKMLLLEGLQNVHGKDLHGALGATLTIRPTIKESYFSGISIDRAIAGHLTSDLIPFSSVNLVYPYRSSKVTANGLNSGYPAGSHPKQIFHRYFGLVGGAVDVREQRRSLLDAMKTDIDRMNQRLAGTEKLRMEQYLDSIRDLEIQLDGTENLNSCVAPVWEGDSWQWGNNNSEMSPELMKYYYDVAAVALACGLSRVVTINHESSRGRYPFEPVNSPKNLHEEVMHKFGGLSNDGTDESWANKEEHVAPVRRLYRWRSSLVADFLDRLDELGVGDKTLTMMINQGGGQHHNGWKNVPLLLIGNPTGNLVTGAYRRYPKEERAVSDGFVTAAQALGINMETFGDPELCRGVLPGLIV